MPNEYRHFNIAQPGAVKAEAINHSLVPNDGAGETVNSLLREHLTALWPGEWLESAGTSTRTGLLQVSRGGDGECSTPGTKDDEGTVPASPVWIPAGAHPELQASGQALIPMLTRYQDFVIETDVVDVTGLAVGDELSVWDYDGGLGTDGNPRWSTVRRALGKKNSGYSVGRCEALLSDRRVRARLYGSRPA